MSTFGKLLELFFPSDAFFAPYGFHSGMFLKREDFYMVRAIVTL